MKWISIFIKKYVNSNVVRFQYEKRDAYLEALPAKLKLFEDFLGDKPYSAGQKVDIIQVAYFCWNIAEAALERSN